MWTWTVIHAIPPRASLIFRDVLKSAPPCTGFLSVHSASLAVLASLALHTKQSCGFLPRVFTSLLIICCKLCWRAEGQQREAGGWPSRLCSSQGSSAEWTGCYQHHCVSCIGKDKVLFPWGFCAWCDSDSPSAFQWLNVLHAITGNSLCPLHFMVWSLLALMYISWVSSTNCGKCFQNTPSFCSWKSWEDDDATCSLKVFASS